MYAFQIFEGKDGFRWRLVAGNGRIVADGSEAYSSRQHVDRAVDSIKKELGLASVDRDEFIIFRRSQFDSAIVGIHAGTFDLEDLAAAAV